MKKLLIILMLFIVPFVYSATLQGVIYDLDFNPVNNAIVTVNSVPEQVIVAKNGEYSIELNQGEYNLYAEYIDGNEKYIANEEISIVSEGIYNSDIILFPDLSEEEELFEEDINVELVEDKGIDVQLITIIAFIIFLIIVAIVFWNKKKPKKTYLDKELTEDIIEFIKKEGGRVTQKDIRMNFHYSEAKISLAISELQNKGRVEKFKKSKGNIIILTEK